MRYTEWGRPKSVGLGGADSFGLNVLDLRRITLSYSFMKFGYSDSVFTSFLKKLGDSFFCFKLNLNALFLVSGEGKIGGLLAEV